MKKVANLVFNPFINDSRVLKESISLAENNYHVEVIAHLDKNLKSTQIQNGFIVKRFSYLDRTITKSKLAKLKAYLLYIKEAVLYSKKFDIIHCNDLNTLPIGFIIKKFYNKDVKVIYDAHEYETEINGLSGVTKKITKLLEHSLINSADAVICVSNAIANEYVKLYNIKKPALVLNTPSYQKIEKKDLFRETFGISKDKTIFLYQGGLSRGRGIEILIQTFEQIDDNNSVIVFMGYGPLEKEIQQASKEYDNIYFHKAVDPDVLLDFTCSADFGISTIENTCLSYRYCLPNKMFEYLMAEIPVIVSNLPEMKQLVEHYTLGVVAQENSVLGLQKAIQQAGQLNKDKLHVNIKKIKKSYNWQEQEKILLKLYNELSL
jgi:glycosyltransferase involved in cell wall biosynthesis